MLNQSELDEMRDLLYMIKDLMGMKMVMKITTFDDPMWLVIPSANERWLLNRCLELREKGRDVLVYDRNGNIC